MVLRTASLEGAGFGKVQELRDALIRFRKSGKPAYAHLEFAGNKEFYLASACDKIFAVPTALLDVTGLAAEVTFFKGTFDKVGVEAQFVGVGKYKNAPNQYTETGFTGSPPRADGGDARQPLHPVRGGPLGEPAQDPGGGARAHRRRALRRAARARGGPRGRAPVCGRARRAAEGRREGHARTIRPRGPGRPRLRRAAEDRPRLRGGHHHHRRRGRGTARGRLRRLRHGGARPARGPAGRAASAPSSFAWTAREGRGRPPT